MRKSDKPLVWIHGDVKSPPFSAEARLEAGFLLRRLQRGESLGLPQSKASKQAKLESAGWRVGSAEESIGLTKDESAYIEMKLALAEALRKQRLKKHLSQVEFAQLIASSQSRVAKMESGDSSVTLDLLVKSLLALGTTKRTLASAITQGL